MFNSINGNTGTTLGLPPGVSPQRFAEEMRAAQVQAAAEAAAAHPTFSGPPAQVAQEITQQFIWGTHQGPLPTDGLQQVIDDLPAALQDNGALTQKMVGLAESLLSNGASGGEDGVLLDYTAAKLALEVAEQPDSGKHGVSERETMPDNGNHTYNVVITPGAPNGIGDGYSVLFKKEHGTFFSQVMGVVDNVITPIVDIGAFFVPGLQPVAIALNVVEGAQQIAQGHDLAGALDFAAAAAAGVAHYAAVAEDIHAATMANNILQGVSAVQGLKGTIQAGIQGDGLAAFASAVGGIGGSGALGGGTGIGNLSRDALVVSDLAGAGVAIQGGNALQALSAVTSAAGEAGLFQNTPPAPALNNRPAATQAYTDPVIPVTATALPDLTPNAAGSGAYGLNGSLGNLIDQSIIGSADSAAFSQPIQEDKGQLGSSGQISNAEVNLGPGFGLPGAGGGAAGPYFEMVPSANGFGGSASSNTQPNNNSNNAQMPPDIGSGSGPSSPGSVASAFRYVFGPVNPQEWEANGALAGGLAGGIVGGGIGGAGGALGGALGGTLVAPGVGTAGGAIAGGDAGALSGIGIGAAAGAGILGWGGLTAADLINYMEGNDAQGNSSQSNDNAGAAGSSTTASSTTPSSGSFQELPPSPPGTLIGSLDNLSSAEQTFVQWRLTQGDNIEIVPTGSGRTPDFIINGVPIELKTLSGVANQTSNGLSAALSNRILNARGQSSTIIVDAMSQPGMTQEIAQRGINRAIAWDIKNGQKIQSIDVLTPDGPINFSRK